MTTFCLVAVLAVVVLLPACAPHLACGRQCGDAALAPSAGSETTRTITLAPGATATIVSPARIDPKQRIDLVLYALPNGNTTAQTMGRRLTAGLDWHFDIQHIAAQTRALRTMGMPQLVVAYLEADTKSWPAWRQRIGYDVANKQIVAMVERLRAEVGGSTGKANVSVTLTGHSGGGSFMFGVLEGQNDVPDWIERIAFLDANYNFEAKHGPTLVRWLLRDPGHTLVSIAYDDREIMLDGKKVVSDSGGTWRATERMLRVFRAPFALADDTLGAFQRHHGEQIEILAHPNPANRILHTELVGEMNGYMHALLVRRPEYERNATLLVPNRAYLKWVEPR